MKFRIVDLKTYTTSQLKNFRAKAILSQGYGSDYSQLLDNRINMIEGRIKKLEREEERSTNAI